MSNLQQNFLAQHRAVLLIPDFKDQDYNLVKFNLPGISLQVAEQATPFSDIKWASDKLAFNELNTTFLVSEDLSNWLELLKWFFGLGFPETYDQFAQKKYGYKDIKVVVYSNANNPVLTVTYHDAFPLVLGDLEFDTQSQEYVAMNGTVSFAYTRYTVSFPTSATPPV